MLIHIDTRSYFNQRLIALRVEAILRHGPIANRRRYLPHYWTITTWTQTITTPKT